MKVILTEKVKSLGSVGEVVNVSEGHARNFLIPGRKAVLADESNKKQMEDYQKMLAKKVEAEKADAKAIAKQLDGLTVSIIKKVGGNGSLFGTVTSNDLSKALEEKGINVEKRQISVDTAIKTLGIYDVTAKLFKDVEATFKVSVEQDAAQAEEMKKKQELLAQAKKNAQAKAKEEEKSVAEQIEGESESEAKTEEA